MTVQTTTDPTTTDTTFGTTAGHTTGAIAQERLDLLESLRKHRFFLRLTVQGLSDEQAGRRTTASRLCLGGLIKHVTHAERSWLNFVLERPGGPSGAVEGSLEKHELTFTMLPEDTLESLLAAYEQVAAQTDEAVATLPDLDVAHPLPPAPWFEPGAQWTARRVLLHIIAETAQHAGHADIIRESLDGAKSMG